ncbi:unnamed protein product [Pleuronectes platessa]|uniref:Uncharacterized protein n=1 Tax=Pleuronectes platessa TaxID=8262 RepID=A0A9N7VGJ8_PLEPL|nr:unnamed protein product [Pleuronectes platessa]
MINGSILASTLEIEKKTVQDHYIGAGTGVGMMEGGTEDCGRPVPTGAICWADPCPPQRLQQSTPSSTGSSTNADVTKTEGLKAELEQLTSTNLLIVTKLKAQGEVSRDLQGEKPSQMKEELKQQEEGVLYTDEPDISEERLSERKKTQLSTTAGVYPRTFNSPHRLKA